MDPFKDPKGSRFPKDIEMIWNLLTTSEAVKKSLVEGEYECVNYALEVKEFLNDYGIFSTIAAVFSYSKTPHGHALIAIPSYVRKEWFFFDWNALPYTLPEVMKRRDKLIIFRPRVNDKRVLQCRPILEKHIWYQYPPGLLKPLLREWVVPIITSTITYAFYTLLEKLYLDGMISSVKYKLYIFFHRK